MPLRTAAPYVAQDSALGSNEGHGNKVPTPAQGCGVAATASDPVPGAAGPSLVLARGLGGGDRPRKGGAARLSGDCGQGDIWS